MRTSTARKYREAKVERLELRASPRQAAVIRQAATTMDKTVTAFILDAATLEAQRALADRRLFSLNSARWQRFLSALDRPEREIPRLTQLMKGSIDSARRGSTLGT